LNRAFDSLRKFPLFLMDTDIHLNQGFHDLIVAGNTRTAAEMARRDLLIIRHYKMRNTLSDAASPSARPTSAYHHETRANLERLRNSIDQSLYRACMSPFVYYFFCHSLMPIPGCTRITIRTQPSLEKDAIAR